MMPGPPAVRTAPAEMEAMTERVWVVGAPVSAVDMRSAIVRIRDWVREKRSRYVCLTDVRSIMLARSDPALDHALKDADLVLADGMPLVWTARSRGVKSIGRVAGPDFMHEICRLSPGNWTHFLLGGAKGVPERLTQSLTALNPGLSICGTYSPPFLPLSEAEDNEIVERLNSAKPDIVWIGLGCPKQELWMAQHAGRVPGAIMIGVGAAFDFLSGRIPRAPRWMRNNGLEWLHRLLTEPRRLWKRYLVLAPKFVVLAAVETTAIWWRRPPNRKKELGLAKPAG
jgi:N-acetylglucosaminyldiphosphoundecaprenol N-acetyl-beta-D-mannosaminyltransferase